MKLSMIVENGAVEPDVEQCAELLAAVTGGAPIRRPLDGIDDALVVEVGDP